MRTPSTERTLAPESLQPGNARGGPSAARRAQQSASSASRLASQVIREQVSKVRGARLVTKLMLVGLPLALLFVPWFSFLLLDQIETISVQMQSNHQQLIADSIAINFNGKEELLEDLPVDPSDSDLVARPIQSPVRLNASALDWGEEALRPRRFGPPGDGSFELYLGTRREERDDQGDRLMLYAYLEITDDIRVYRNPDFLRLNNADHVRISFLEADGDAGRIAVTLSVSGDTTAYRMDADWTFAQEGGLPENEVRGLVRETVSGYALELRLPFELVGSGQSAARSGFTLTFVDVDDPETRTIRATIGTLADSDLVVHRSPEVLKILEDLGFSGMGIRIIDAQRNVRAEVGGYRTEDDPRRASRPTESGWFAYARRGLTTAWNAVRRWVGKRVDAAAGDASREQIENRIIESALAGDPLAARLRVGDVETIVAGQPIISEGDSVIGAVVVEQNIDDIQIFQRQAIDNLALVSVFSFVGVLVCLVLFAGRLTWRIRSLRREVTSAIDEYGRLQTSSLKAGMSSGDEIGDLSRSVSNMLARLEQHTDFLQKMPRTLRHEINNPLNTLITSLDQLAQEDDQVRRSKYLESARRGVLRIGAIVQNLADAANLEESLASEDMEVIDIRALLESYVVNCRTTHEGQQFDFRAPSRPIYANAADYRIEQLLDKLIDNAVDFHRSNTPIRVQLDVRRDWLQITVANRGPMLPPDATGSLFESMVSRRARESKLHFGLGLYVVRAIAEQHGGTVWAMNLEDRSGVAFMVRLPLAITDPGTATEATVVSEPSAAG